MPPLMRQFSLPFSPMAAYADFANMPRFLFSFADYAADISFAFAARPPRYDDAITTFSFAAARCRHCF